MKKLLMLALPLMTSLALSCVPSVAMAGPSSPKENAETPFPFKLYDTHAHFYSDDLARFPLHAEKAYMGPEKMKEIVLTRPSTAARVFGLWDQQGVEAGVGVQYSAAYESDNAYLLDVAGHHPARVHPVVILSLADKEAPHALDRMVKTQGVVGIRMPITRDESGRFPWLDSAVAQQIWEVAELRQLAVVLFPPLRGEQSRSTSDALVARVPALARQYPHVQIVLDHMGWPEAKGAPDFGFTESYQALTQPNVFFKVTSVNFLTAKGQDISPSVFLRRAVDVFGARKIMWGSDQGNTPVAYEEMVGLAKDAAARLTPDEARQVFRETGMQVFGR